MVELFSKFWWTFVVRGFVAVLFGLILILWSGLSLDLLVLTFGIFTLLQGIFSVTHGLSKLGGRVYFLLIEGVMGILAGVLTFLGPGIGRMLWPEVATKTLLVFIILWASLTGIAEVIGSFRLPGEIKEKWIITPEWIRLSFARCGSAFSTRAWGCGECVSDRTLCDCFWPLVVIRGLKSSKTLSKKMIIIR